MHFVKQISLGVALATGTAMLVASPTAYAQSKKDKKDKKDADKADAIKLSKEYQEGYNESVKLFQAEDYPAAKAKWEETLPMATSSDDKYAAGNLGLQIGVKTDDPAQQKRGIDLLLLSERTSPEDRARYSFFAGQMAFQDDDNANAIEFLNTAYEAGYRQNGIETLLAEANNRAQNFPEAFRFLDAAIASEESSGKKAPENYYKRGAGIALDAKDYTKASDYLSRLVLAYPNPANWRDALTVYRDQVQLSEGENLDLMRLMRRADAMVSENDYGEYVDAANARRLPGEVKLLIEEGRANGDLDGSSAYLSENLATANSRIESDRSSLGSAERDARSAGDGKIASATADAYLGYADYKKASELYTVALEKGGVDDNEVRTRRGIARLEMGDYDGAKTDFASIESGNRAGIARYWTVHADLKAGGSPAAAPQPAAEAEPVS